MAKVIVSNNIGTAVQLYDFGSGSLPWSPLQPPNVIPVGTSSGLLAAVQNANYGDIIEIIEPGVYSPNSTLIPNASNVTIRGHKDASPNDIILRGPGMDNSNTGNRPHGVYSQYPGLKLENFTIEQFYFHAVTFGAGAGNPTFRNMIMQDIGQQTIKASAYPLTIDNGVVENCVFRFTSGRPMTDHAGGGYFYNGFIDGHRCSNWTVQDSFFGEITPTQEEIDFVLSINPSASINYWSPAVYFWNGSSNNTIQRNIFHNNIRSVALGLIDQLSLNGFYDHVGGIVKNNFIVIDVGRLSSSQTLNSDAAILLWNCQNGKAKHNTILTNGQITDSIQGRWTTSLEISANLVDRPIRMREAASYSGINNQLNASPSWFVDSISADLRLNTTGSASVSVVGRDIDCQFDFDKTLRPSVTNIGAHHYV